MDLRDVITVPPAIADWLEKNYDLVHGWVLEKEEQRKLNIEELDEGGNPERLLSIQDYADKINAE